MPTVSATSPPTASPIGMALTTLASKIMSGSSSSFGRNVDGLIGDQGLIAPTHLPFESLKTNFIDNSMIETTTTTTATARMLDNILLEDQNNMEILNQQQATARGSSLYSIDEIIHLAPTDCTALIHALLASFSVILVSELGDKTFIITAIMAMKNSRLLVFISSALALLSMTILSVGLGVAVTVIPKLYTYYGSIVLFLCFGLKMLYEAYDMEATDDCESEFDEVKRSLEDDNSTSRETKSIVSPSVPNETLMTAEQIKGIVHKLDPIKQQQQSNESSSRLTRTLFVAPIVIKVFTMIFIAEWGDRSQISTVILAAREDVVGVFIGSLSGHVLCTGMAVIGGRFVADMISVRTMTLLGGIIFLFFAIFALITRPEV